MVLIKAVYVVAALHTGWDLSCLKSGQELRFVVFKLDSRCSIPVRESTWRRLFSFDLVSVLGRLENVLRDCHLCERHHSLR